MKKYKAKDPFTSSTYGKKIDVYREKPKSTDAHIGALGGKSVPSWDKPLSKRLTF